VTDRLHELTARLQPGLGDIAVMNSWVGQRTFARDRKFVIGFDPRDRRIFHVAGLGGHGVTASPAVGRLAADLLLNGEPTQPNPFDPARLISAA
jgi:glycine/D-amino acid oxidase-like deaminating enzyme